MNLVHPIAIAVALVATVPLVAPAGAAPPSAYDEYLATLRDATGGDLPAEFVRHAFEADALGNVVVVARVLPFDLHLDAVRRVVSSQGVPALSNADREVGYGSERGLLGEDNWARCDDASSWVDQIGRAAHPTPTAQFPVAPLDAAGTLGTGTTCNDAFGKTLVWPDLTFDLRKANRALQVTSGAFANHWLSDDAGGPRAGGHLVASHQGEGVYFWDTWCFFGICETFEAFLGNGAVVSLGSDTVPPPGTA